MNSTCDSGKADLLAEEEALRLLRAAAQPITETELIALDEAHGRILARTLKAAVDVPPADNSAMDGYAVRAADCREANTRLRVTQRIPAGVTGKPVESGTAARIFTGAPLPAGSDAVVMQEHCSRDGDDVILNTSVSPGSNVRLRGEDIARDSDLLVQGTRLLPQHVGLAASVGISEVPVYRKLHVAVFFTGDELTSPGQALMAGKIYNSNRYVLSGLLQRLGCEVIDLGDVADTLAATRDTLIEAASVADIVLTSGGVSVGEEDHVRSAVAELGRLDLWNLAIKPGKPLAFGNIQGIPFFGLPGNPVSLFITFCLYARPFLLISQGRSCPQPRFLWVRAGFERSRGHSRREYLRARLARDAKGQDSVQLYPHQGSGVLNSLAWAEGLVCIPENGLVAYGDMVRYLPLEALLT